MNDLDTLVRLRLEFLDELSQKHPTALGRSNEETGQAIHDYFSRAIPCDEFRAWIAETQEQIVGTSGLVILQKPPNGANLTGREAYIMNMYTIPVWRRKGIAQSILEHMIHFVRTTDVTCVRLHASTDGEGIYRSVGFTSIATEMRLNLA